MFEDVWPLLPENERLNNLRITPKSKGKSSEPKLVYFWVNETWENPADFSFTRKENSHFELPPQKMEAWFRWFSFLFRGDISGSSTLVFRGSRLEENGSGVFFSGCFFSKLMTRNSEEIELTRLAGTQQEILVHESLQPLVDGVKWPFLVLVTGRKWDGQKLQWTHGVYYRSALCIYIGILYIQYIYIL